MILIIISAFVVCAVSGIGSLKYMERQERNVLRLLDDIEMERAEKLRCEKLMRLNIERNDALQEMELLNEIIFRDNLHIDAKKMEDKQLKSAYNRIKQSNNLSKKITKLDEQIKALE